MGKKKSIVLIKIGGSLITDKNKPFSVKKKALKVIVGEIKKASKLNKWLIVGHGAGSFAHVPAKKYQTHKGIINKQSYKGIAVVADVAAQLNRIVVKEMISQGIKAVSVSPLSMMLAKGDQLETIYSDSLEEVLNLGLLPVVYGDPILDKEQGCAVFSTERVLGFLGLHLKKKGYTIEKVIHCGKTDGVYDAEGRTIEMINSKNMDRYIKILKGSDGMDVTGGMMHKVKETYKLSKKGITGLIIDGVEKGTLVKAVKNEPVLGTRIEK